MDREDFERWYMESQRTLEGYIDASASAAWRAWRHKSAKPASPAREPFTVGIASIGPTEIRTYVPGIKYDVSFLEDMRLVDFVLLKGGIVEVSFAPYLDVAWLELTRERGGRLDRVLSAGSTHKYAIDCAMESSKMGRPCLALIEYNVHVSRCSDEERRHAAAYWPTHVMLASRDGVTRHSASEIACALHASNLDTGGEPRSFNFQVPYPGTRLNSIVSDFDTGVPSLGVGVYNKLNSVDLDALASLNVNALRAYGVSLAVWGNRRLDGSPIDDDPISQ